MYRTVTIETPREATTRFYFRRIIDMIRFRGFKTLDITVRGFSGEGNSYYFIVVFSRAMPMFENFDGQYRIDRVGPSLKVFEVRGTEEYLRGLLNSISKTTKRNVVFSSRLSR